MPEIIKFYIKEEPYGFLSNFWRVEQYSHGKNYKVKTNENGYQSEKAKDPLMRDWIAKAPTAYAAMMAGKNLKPDEIVDDWDNKKVEVMRIGLLAKFSQNYLLGQALLRTGDAILIEDSPTDMFWGGRLEGSQNMLGKLLMEVREELRKQFEEEIKEEITPK
jgi:hypothetical protein